MRPNRSGKCMCGCGQTTAIARQTDSRHGLVGGEHVRYVSGHNPTPTLPLAARLAPKYEVNEETGCWEWTASGYGGYGRIRSGGHVVQAHRAMWEERRGSIPPGYELHHECGNRACVNPDHLTPVTRREHVQARSSFTEADILLIRESRASSSELARLYGCRVGTISDIRLGRTWRNVAGPIREPKYFRHLAKEARRAA